MDFHPKYIFLYIFEENSNLKSKYIISVYPINILLSPFISFIYISKPPKNNLINLNIIFPQIQMSAIRIVNNETVKVFFFLVVSHPPFYHILCVLTKWIVLPTKRIKFISLEIMKMIVLIMSPPPHSYHSLKKRWIENFSGWGFAMERCGGGSRDRCYLSSLSWQRKTFSVELNKNCHSNN